MKKLFLLLIVVTATATASFAQMGLSSSATVGVAVDVRDVLQLDVTAGGMVTFVYDAPEDFESSQAQMNAVFYRVRSTVPYAVTALANSPTLTDASSGESIPFSALSVASGGASAPSPLSSVTPITLVAGGVAGSSAYSLDVYSNLPWTTASGLYNGEVTITATQQ